MQAAAIGQSARNVDPAPNFWALSDWAFSLSVANICFFRTWAALLERGRHIVPTAFVVAIVNVLLMAVAIRIAYYLIRRSRSQILRWIGILGFAGLVMLPFHALTTVNFAGDVPKRNITYVVALAVAGLIVLSRRVRHGVQVLFLILTPFVLVTFGQSISRIQAYNPAQWNPPTLPAAAQPSTTRVVWLLFDEWDYGITFGPKGPPMPELQRILATSFQASNAQSPEKSTARSVPRLVTGDMTATVDNASKRKSIFSRAKEAGFRTAAVGWFIDYCGLFGASLDACWSSAIDAERGSMGTSVGEIASNQLKNIFENQFRSPFGQPLGAKRHVVDYRFILRSATTAVGHPGLDFVYVHFPIPHEPLFYDSSTGRFDLGEVPILSFFKKDFPRYIDALQLADITLGKMRRVMEETGTWENTHLILTSDHAYRQRRRLDTNRDDERVPFIVRVAGSSEPVVFKDPINTVVAADLVSALTSKQIRTTEDIRTWLSQRTSPRAAAGAPGSHGRAGR